MKFGNIKSENNLKIFLVIFLILFSVFTRFWQLDNPDPSGDELSYIDEAYLLNIGDPRINFRHHMFHHPPPNFPHPFLVNGLIAVSFKTFGYNLYAARLPVAFFSFLTIFLTLFLVYKLSSNFNISLLSAWFIAILPLNIRYARESYLDAPLAFFVVATTLVWVLFLQKKQSYLAILSGIFLALALSTKITAIALIPALIITGLSFLKPQKKLFLILFLTLIASFVTFFIFNSPLAYLDGLINHPNTRTDNWGPFLIVQGLFWPQYWSFWGYMIIYNFSLPLVLLFLFVLFKNKTKAGLNIKIFSIFSFIYSIFAITTHLPSSISGPWAFQPEADLGLIILAWFETTTLKKTYFLVIFSVLILPLSIIHGLRLTNDPFIPYHNVKFGETNVITLTNDVNSLAAKKDQFYLNWSLNSSTIPEWLWAKNINFKPWTHTQPLDAFITDDSYPQPIKNFYLAKRYFYSQQNPLNLYLKNN